MNSQEAEREKRDNQDMLAEQARGVLRDLERAVDTVTGLNTPLMQGDNLAIILCNHFDNPDQPNEEDGWSEDATTGYEEVRRAIQAHFAPALAELAAFARASTIPDGAIEYEVWQEDAFGDGDAMVAGSTSLADAQHYALVYGQDGPAWVVEVTRRPLDPPLDTVEGV